MVELSAHSKMFPIQCYTTFSIFSGTREPECWAKAIKEKGYNTAGICDKQTLGGVIEFQKACIKNGIKPVIGSEFLVADVLGKSKDKGGSTKGVVLLYAASQKGIKNLIAINNFSHRRSGGFSWFPRVSLSFFEENPDKAEDIICVVPVFEGYGLTVEDLDLTAFKKSLDPSELSFKPDKISRLSDIFKDKLYIGINPLRDDMSMKHTPISGGTNALFCDSLIFRHFNSMAMSFHCKKILTFDSHYLDEDDHRLYYSISKVSKGSSGTSRSCKYRDVYRGFIPSVEELDDIIEEFTKFDAYDNPPCMTIEDVNDCYDNMMKLNKSIADDAVVELNLVKFPVPLSQNPEKDLLQYIFEGFKKNLFPEADITDCKTIDDMDRFYFEDEYPFEHTSKGEDTSILKPLKYYVDQIKYEFNIIKKLNFINYFWFVRDITSYVDSIGETRGPARGSAAGSLLAYLLEITLIDPMRHNLSFDRFLNEDRNDLPDIDLDFSQDSVLKVREFIKKKYGEEFFCRICNTGRWKVVSAIKDIAKAFDHGIKDNNGVVCHYSFSYLNSLTANSFIKATLRGQEELDERVNSSSEFSAFYHKHSDWIDGTVMPLLETVSSNGIHASGNLILPDIVDNCLPIIEKSDVGYVSQWCDTDCEAAGFPKFDFLVIDGADIITYMKTLIKANNPEAVIPSIKEIPLDDPETLLEFQRSRTDGVFQYKTYSFKRMLRKFIINSFDVLTILATVNRPAAISAGVPDQMAETQHGRKPVTYDHPDFEDILKESYGYMIYQEQMMKIVQKMASLTGKQTDHVRKACGKKKLEEMQKWEEIFISGSIENGYDKDFAESMWSKIVAFSDYSFNKCLVGDTKLYRGGRNRFTDLVEVTIEELYNELQKIGDYTYNGKKYTAWGYKIARGLQKVRMMNADGRIRLGHINGIYQNGIKEVYKVTLDNGMNITGTSNHRLLTDKGYLQIDELSVGDNLIVQGVQEKQFNQYAERAVKGGSATGKHWSGAGDRRGANNPSFIDGRTNLLKDSIAECKARAENKCENCGCEKKDKDRFEVAHLETFESMNGDFLKFHSLDNLKYLCNSCHKIMDYNKGERSKAWSKGKPTTFSSIKSIEFAGERMTYDIEMKEEEHNFIANGIVSHNSHSASYALIAYYQVYLKVRYPVEYWSAVLQFANTADDKDTSVFNVRTAAEAEGMEFVFPTLDYFDYRFFPVAGKEDTIVWPLGVIKGIGHKAVMAICHEVPLKPKKEKPKPKKKPKKGQEPLLDEIEDDIEEEEVEEFVISDDLTVYPKRTSFESMEDMVRSVDPRIVNKAMFEALIKASFFETEFENNFDAVKAYYAYRASILGKKREVIPIELNHDNAFEWRMRMNEAYGMIVYSWKSFAQFSEQCKVINFNRFERIVNRNWEDGDSFVIGGFVESIASRRDKSNNHYAIMEISDYGEKYTVFLWSKFWTDSNLDLEYRRPQQGQLIEIEVTKRTYNDKVQLSVAKPGSYVKIIRDAIEYD